MDPAGVDAPAGRGVGVGQYGEAAERRNDRGRRRLLIALLITAVFAAVELVTGILTNSLALMADSGHMTLDAAAIALSLFAAWLAARPSTPSKTYGYSRAEILAAQVNGTLLALVAAWTLWQAAVRLTGSTPNVHAGPVVLVALLGLAVNVGVALILRSTSGGLNVRSAMLDAASDALGAAGTAVAGLIILATGWRQADPIVSAFIALLIVRGAWRLLREVVEILLEGTPARINIAEVEGAMVAVPGVAAVHDTHIWTLTSGFLAMSGHAELDGTCDEHAILDALTDTITQRFHIDHVTIQPEPRRHTTDCCGLAGEPGRARAHAGSVR